MKKIAFAIKDLKAGAFTGDPMYAVSRGVAERQFKDAIGDPNLPFGKYPADFELWFVGTFDPVTGEYVALEGGPEFGVNAAQLVRPAQAPSGDPRQLSVM